MLAVGAVSFLSPSLWGTARYGLRYCLKGALNPNQPNLTSCTCLLLLRRQTELSRACTSKLLLALIGALDTRHNCSCYSIILLWGWSGGAMVLGKLPVPGRPTVWMIVGQGPIALAVGAGGRLFGHFFSPLFFLLLLPLGTARYRLKYCLKGPLNPKQPTNQPILL